MTDQAGADSPPSPEGDRPAIVAVTGGTGFIGRHLARELHARGRALRFLIRGTRQVDELPAGVELVLGDLGDEGALRRLVDGAETVIHLAGAIKARRKSDFHRINADGTARLVAACEVSNSVRSLIVLSSLAAREPQISPYAASKRAAEDAVTGCSSGLSWSILRAPAVYGPGDTETLTLFRLAKLKFVPVANGGFGRVSLIHVEDLARLISDMVQNPPPSDCYSVDDGTGNGYSQSEIMSVAAGLLGRSPLLIPIPRFLLFASAALSQGVARLIGQPAIFSFGKAREMCHPDWVVHDRRLADHLSFQPRFHIQNGFCHTIRWYRHHKQL